MRKLNPLIITATPNICWLQPDVDYPKTTPDIIEEAARCRENGTAVLHTHAEGNWAEVIGGVRGKTDLLIQSGMSSIPLQGRIGLFESKSDMVSIILNHHAEAFAELNCDVLHPLAELEEYAVACRKYGVKPEWEVWHPGSIWNLNRLIEQGLLDPPYINTLFFGWPGGTWSPPTVQEYLYRRSLMPANCALTVSIMCAEQMDILVNAIIHGDNVRVGTEDYPYNQQGKLAKTHELVKEIADISRALGREVATPAQAREMLGIG
ncbi:3-keto-5-aminohexanoate cleavage protein [Cohnella caldifontis]|uniref:3-keto-5-aminohexanoate cleavage protein n=1 Tax=Cohnella caldifontis TaxID=3027471 RepID=UPI0023EE10B0|nr:3-keto-5-aminohexanoate cleavage protein [Cohnella sp. YIM B05605]